MDYLDAIDKLYGHVKYVVDNANPYAIEKVVGINHSKIYRIRHGQVKINNLSFETIIKLVMFPLKKN